jgi:thiamine biosynthesis lipoprotein
MGEEVWFLLHRCRDLWKETDGAFDVSVGPLIDLWKIGTEEERVPSQEEIDEALNRIGLDRVIWEGDCVRLPEGMEIHLGGVLKGYALERSAAVLRDLGVAGALINAGGDIYALGNRSGGGKWRVGVQHPRIWGAYFGKLEISDAAAATSGDYFQFFEIGGRRYHHILDPRTGYPAEGCLSATIIAPDPVRADAWATAAVVLGRTLPGMLEGGKNGEKSLQFVLVLEDGTIRTSADIPAATPLPEKLDW